MITALGYSENPFDPADPGRLCRGRERWIEPWDLAPGDVPPIARTVVSGAAFSDDSARDARRGLPHSGIDVATVITALFPRKSLLAFMEDGHPADIPEGAEGIEAYSGWRAGGRSEEVLVRWHKVVSGADDVRDVLHERQGTAPEGTEYVRGFAVLEGDDDVPALLDKLFVLVGMSTLDSPPARFQPAALPELLETVPAVIVLHRDKHGPALGIYSREPLPVAEKLGPLCEKAGVLLVPFAIPPMLARWDRALAELRETWSETHDSAFPVPSAPEPSTWEPRRRRRRRGEAVEEEEDLMEAPVAAVGADEEELAPDEAAADEDEGDEDEGDVDEDEPDDDEGDADEADDEGEDDEDAADDEGDDDDADDEPDDDDADEEE